MKNVLRGMLLGLANILPGVSGGTLAISMGIYEKLLSCAGNFFSDIKGNFRFLFPLGVGMAVAMLGSVIGLDYIFSRYELQANLLFIGLILGSFPAIYGKVRRVTIQISHVGCALAFFSLVTMLSMVHDVWGVQVSLEVGIIPAIKLFLVGIIAAATMVIPGVSGSMVLLLLGYYKPILAQIEGCIEAVCNFEIAEAFGLGLLLVPFGVGVIAGIVLVAKLTMWLFARFEAHVYFAIIGLLIASPIGILMMGDYSKVTAAGILVGVVLFIAGLFVSSLFGERREG